MFKFNFLCNGDETQESWKPLLNTIPALRGSSEWFAQLEFEHNLFSTRRPSPTLFPIQERRKNAQLPVVGNDSYWHPFCRFLRQNAGHHHHAVRFLQRSRHPLHHDDGRHVLLDRTHGNRRKIRHPENGTDRLSPLIHFLFPELPKKIIRQKNQLQQTSLQMYSDLAGRQLRQVLKQWKSFRSWKKTAALEKQQMTGKKKKRRCKQ